jgi:hypothetical protein
MENCKAHFRNQVFRHDQFQYRPQASGDYYGHVWEQRKINQLPQADSPGWIEPALAKTKLILPLTMPPHRMAFSRTANPPKLKDRPIDFFFSGRLVYNQPPPFPEQMRHRLWRKWAELPGKKEFVATSIWATGLKYFDYLERMCQTKIAISPWGFGAWNIRDYEALMCGCVLVKPECSGLKVIPDIYDPKELLCHMCDVDLSNLTELCESILRYIDEFQPLVDRGRRIMEETFDPPNRFVHTWCQEMLAAAE